MFLENLVFVLSWLGLVQSALLCVYLFSLKDKKTNLLLALMLLGLILPVGNSVLNNYMYVATWVRVVGISGKLVVGPLLWFYGKALFEKEKFSSRHYLHMVPFILSAMFSWIIPNGADFKSYLLASLIFLHLGFYLVACWMYILKVIEGERLRSWYRNIVSGVTFIWFLYLGIFTGMIPVYILGAVFFSFLIYLFSYLLLKRHIFVLEKYNNSAVSNDAAKQLLQKLRELFEEKEIYLDSMLSLKNVAEKLDTAPRDLSQVINERTQMNFSEFVNHYRVARAKSLLAAPQYQQQKIETIAYDCGFGNVTSFNLAFKAETAMTPSQYRNQFSNA